MSEDRYNDRVVATFKNAIPGGVNYE